MPLIKTGHGLWSKLVKDAALNLRLYDKDVASDFRRNLKLPETGSIVGRLRERKVLPEPVLGGFLGSVQPFTRMFRDILDMVEWAGMRAGHFNLLIKFDFEAGKEFKLDLDNFRRQVERFSTAVRPLIIESWNPNRLWGLVHALGNKEGEPRDPVIRRWLDEYDRYRLPVNEPGQPKFNDPEVDELMGRVWQVWRAMIEVARHLTPSRAAWARAAGVSPEPLTLEGRRAVISEGAKQTVADVLSDLWAEGLASRAYLRAEEATVDPSLARRLKSVLDNPPPVRRDVEQAIGEVEDVLKLPIWKHRHELYSVWVLTQIVSALGGWQRFKFELKGDEFHIPFSPTLLGTVEELRPPVRVWGEVRYPLRSPGGKSRVGGMQPDYSLTIDTRYPPKEAFALVECKQYLQSSSKNFREALTDYAKGQPGATVVLVNYGPVAASVMRGVPTRLRSSVEAIGHFHPLRQDSLKKFADWVRAQVEKHTVAPEDETAAAAQPIGAGAAGAHASANLARVELNWGRWPSDLDLHLFVPTSDGKWDAVNFNREGELEAWPWARLAADVTDGFGPEVIDIRKASPGLYRVAVKLYSNEAPLAGSGAALTLQVEGLTATRFDCPAVGSGVWWHVCDVDFLAPLVTEVNRIGDTASPWGPA